MITSRITAKAQTTIPRPIRVALDLQPGDDLAYEIRDGVVLLGKMAPLAGNSLPADIATFTEWNSEADRVGYGEL